MQSMVHRYNRYFLFAERNNLKRGACDSRRNSSPKTGEFCMLLVTKNFFLLFSIFCLNRNEWPILVARIYVFQGAEILQKKVMRGGKIYVCCIYAIKLTTYMKNWVILQSNIIWNYIKGTKNISISHICRCNNILYHPSLCEVMAFI